VADAHSLVTGRVTPPHKAALNILALAPLPFYCDGKMTFVMGGTNFYAALLPGLARLGHTVRVIAQALTAQEGQHRTGLAWDFPNLTVEWFALEYRSGSTPPPAAFLESEKRRLTPLFDRLVHEQRPDVVLIGRQDLVWNGLDCCRAHELPALLIPHSAPLAAFKFGAYPQAARQALLDRFYQVDCIVAVAQHLADLLISLGLTRVCTILNNVADPARFFPAPKDSQLLQKLQIASHQLVVSHCSNLRPKKRPLDLVHAAERVLRSYPETVYLIVGDGPCRQEMEGLGKEKNIATSFRYVGEVAPEEMPRYLNLSDIVVLPSEREGLSLVCREVQACGRVLLTSDIPAAREAIIDRETGVLFRMGDIDDLAAKTLVLAQDPLLRQQIGGKARIAALAQTPEQWVHAYVEVLQQTAAHYRVGV
jgi:glycosyltransferase involved in cell wall biosynthesis